MSGRDSGKRNELGPIDISFAVACFNAGAYLEPAIRSALEQDRVRVEVLVVDDGSTDGSREMVEAMAKADPRVVALQTTQNSGPGGARNVAIENMQGRWFAVLDADDLLLPERSYTLLAVAERHQADAVADNPILFGENIQEASMFSIAPPNGARKLELAEYFERSCLFGRQPSPGYLKPMLRRRVIEQTGLRYNAALRIGEDDEFMVRALASNTKYVVSDFGGYRYRRHEESISHRLSLENLERMMAAERDIAVLLPPAIAKSAAFRKRWKALVRAHAFTASVDAIKDRSYLSALSFLLRQPSAVGLFAMPLAASFKRAKTRLPMLSNS